MLYYRLANADEIDTMTAKEVFEKLEALENVRIEECMYHMMSNSGSKEIYDIWRNRIEQVYPYAEEDTESIFDTLGRALK